MKFFVARTFFVELHLDDVLEENSPKNYADCFINGGDI